MQRLIGNYQFELANDTIYITEAATGDLLKAKTFKAYDAVDKFEAICRHYQAKLKQPAF